jgi:hypothetical protein
MSIAMINTKVLITAIIAGASIVIAFIGGLVFLSVRSVDSSMLLSLVSTLMSAFNTILLVMTRSSVTALQVQTNGTQQKLIDAAIAAPSPKEL